MPCVLVHLVSRKKTIVRGNLTPGVHVPVRASRLLFQDSRHLAMDNKELLLENKRLNAELQRLGSPMAKPDEEVRVELVLDMDMADIEDDAEEFKGAVVEDVASAVEGNPNKVRVISLEAGSIRVLMALDEGVCDGGVRALDVANDLQKQVDDPDSRLKQGRFTRASTAASVSVVKMPMTTSSLALAPRAEQAASSNLDSGETSLPDEVQLAEMRVAHLQMENETLHMQKQDLEAHSTDLQYKLHALRQELDSTVAAKEGQAPDPSTQAAAANNSRDMQELRLVLEKCQDEAKQLAEKLESATLESEQLGFDLEMTKRVSEDRAQQLEESLRVQRDLQDQVDRLSLLSGWQQHDLPGHEATFAPEIVGLDAGDDAAGAHESYRMGHAAESVQVPPEAAEQAQARAKGRVKLGAAPRPLEQFSPADNLAGGEGAWKAVNSAEEADAMKELHNERDRCDALTERIAFLEEELADISEEQELMMKEREDLMEEHKVLAMSFQDVKGKLMKLREESGITADSSSEASVHIPSLKSSNQQFDEHHARLAGVLEKRRQDLSSAPPAGALYKVSPDELLLLVEECVENEQAMAERIYELEDANESMLLEHDALAAKVRELLQARQGNIEDEDTDEVRLELVLDMDIADVHPDDEREFKEAVAQDVAAAVGGDASKVRVLALEPGSIRVHTALDAGVCGDEDPLHVAQDLAQQASDPNSALKRGRFTSATTGANVSIAKVPAAATGPPSSSLHVPGHGTQKLQQTAVELDVANRAPGEAVAFETRSPPVVSTISPTEEPPKQQAAPQARRGHSAKLGSAAPPQKAAAPVASDFDRAEQESKQQAFVEEIARLSAVAEERRCELLDTHAKIAALQDELGVQHKRSQKAAADMYVEMDRMQAQMDANNGEIKDLLTQLHDSQTYAKEWEEHSIKEKLALETKAEKLEARLAASEQDKEALRAKHEASQAETAEFLAKLDGNTEATRLMDENRLHEISRLQGELERAHAEKAETKALQIEAEAALHSKEALMGELKSQHSTLQKALEAEQNAHAKAVAEVFALQTEGISRGNVQVGGDAAAIKSAFLDEAALLDRLSMELQEATRERDYAQGRAEDLTQQLAEVRSQQVEGELRLKEWKETSRDEHQRVRQEMMALSEQLQDLAMENSNLRGERESLLHTLSDARRAQGAAEEGIGRLEQHMREMEEEMHRDRQADQNSTDLAHQDLLDAQDRVLQLESERLILAQTVEAGKKRVRDTELQRDAMLPQLRSLTEDLRRVQVRMLHHDNAHDKSLARTHARTHSCTHTRTRARTHTCTLPYPYADMKRVSMRCLRAGVRTGAEAARQPRAHFRCRVSAVSPRAAGAAGRLVETEHCFVTRCNMFDRMSSADIFGRV